jgi:hypothetical protein
MKTLILLLFAGLVQLGCLYGQEKKLSPVRSQTKRVTYMPVQEIKTVKMFPNLVIKDLTFKDENSNNIFDADENSEIALKLVNEGKGVAEAVILRVSTKNPVPGMLYKPQYVIGNIDPGQSVDIIVPVTTDLNIQNGLAEFRLEVIENNGFDSFPLEMTIGTRQFQEPKVKVVDAVFSTDEGGRIVLNYPINLKILVQNIGNGHASNVKAELLFMKENCIMLDNINSFELGSLEPGQAVELDFPFTATRRFADNQIPIRINLEEKYNQFAKDTVVSVGLYQSLLAGREVIIEGKPSENYNIEIASLVAEVDRNIPFDSTKYTNKYALIIGNEDYTDKQTGINNETNVIYAKRDAEVFSEYLIKTLGFDEENVNLLRDATAAEMNQSIDLLTKLAQRTDSAEIVFYYAGHGFPDEIAQMPYLIPVDVNGTNLSNAIKLTDLYNKLENSNAKHISIYLDACFSGGGRNNELLPSRGIRIKPKVNIPPANTIVFSASSGEQSALPYTSKQHGIFTYYLLKKLQDTKGNITYGDLADYLQTQVSLQSLKINKKEQDPQVIYGDNKRENWVNKSIK